MARAIPTYPVEDLLIWAYQVEKIPIGGRPERLVPVTTHTRDGTYTVATLGMAIFSGSRDCARTHPDADMIAEMVHRLPPLQRVLLERFGLSGLAPCWYPGAYRVLTTTRRRMSGRRVQVEEIITYYREAGRDLPVPGGWQTVEFGRQEYSTWWAALHRLAAALHSQLEGRRPAPPRSPQHPWEQ